jgi:CRISPR system Cascade subunit CasE
MESLYLSRLSLQIRNRAVQYDLSDCHNMHRRLLMGFPDLKDVVEARSHFGLLYRVESNRGNVSVLAQSSGEPRWDRLPEGYVRASDCSMKRVDTLYSALTTGQRLIFRLRANPTRRLSDRSQTAPERWRGKRIELRNEKDQLAWLKEKGEGGGFALLAARTLADVSDVRTLRVGDRVTGSREGKRLTFGSVIFEGRLHITDVATFQQTLTHGIGSGKSYGFGLLSVAPIPLAP